MRMAAARMAADERHRFDTKMKREKRRGEIKSGREKIGGDVIRVLSIFLLAPYTMEMIYGREPGGAH